MDYSHEEYVNMAECYAWADGNGALAARHYRQIYPQRDRFPCPRVIQEAARRLRERNDILPHRGENGGPMLRQRIPRREEAVLQRFADDPCTSSRRVARELGMSQTTVNRITRAEGLRPFHKNPVHALHGGDPETRLTFCRWVLEEYENDRGFISRILFSDEANFGESGSRNCHNEHYYAHENPHAVRVRGQQVRYSVNVWCGIIGTHVTGAYELPMRLNGQNYLEFLQEHLPDILEDVPLDVRRRMWFQHDGAPAHYSAEVREWLDDRYPNRWIGRGGPVNCPARSPDLNPLDYFLWGHVKDCVYGRNLPEDIDDLCARIIASFDTITEEMLTRVINNFIVRVRKCIEVGGGNFEHLL